MIIFSSNEKFVQDGLKYLVNMYHLCLVKTLVYGLICVNTYLLKDRTCLHISKRSFYGERMILQKAGSKKSHSQNQTACRVGGHRELHPFSEYSVKLKPVLLVATMPVDGDT